MLVRMAILSLGLCNAVLAADPEQNVANPPLRLFAGADMNFSFPQQRKNADELPPLPQGLQLLAGSDFNLVKPLPPPILISLRDLTVEGKSGH